jgi:hypothetical protein
LLLPNAKAKSSDPPIHADLSEIGAVRGNEACVHAACRPAGLAPDNIPLDKAMREEEEGTSIVRTPAAHDVASLVAAV